MASQLEDIKEQLGHSTIAITSDIYTSILAEPQANAENTARVLSSKRKKNKQPAY